MKPTRETELAKLEDLARAGSLTVFPSGASGPSGFVVNRPIFATR